MIGMIAAVSENGVIGLDNKLPFNYPEDMKHFRKTTANSTVIMGRKTFESIGRALPKRRNIVISKNKIEAEGVETFASVKEAMATTQAEQDVWFIGGASIYEEAMRYVNKIVLTLTPDVITGEQVVRFPWVNPSLFQVVNKETLPDPKLVVYIYERK